MDSALVIRATQPRRFRRGGAADHRQKRQRKRLKNRRFRKLGPARSRRPSTRPSGRTLCSMTGDGLTKNPPRPRPAGRLPAPASGTVGAAPSRRARPGRRRRPGNRDRQPACKPGSVRCPDGSGHVTAIHLGRPLRDASRDLPERLVWKRTGRPFGRPRRSYSVLLPVGFTMPVLLPVPRWALTPPFHPYRRGGRRFAFCGTFPRV